MLFVKAITIFICVSCLSTICQAEYPLNWPWIGVTVNNISSTPSDLTIIKERLPGTNSIRLTLKPRLLAKNKSIHSEKAWEKTLKWTDEMLDACRANKVVCIVSISQFPIDPELGLVQSDAGFWKNEKLQEQVVDLVGRLAKHLEHRGDELVAFEILNEPEIRLSNRPFRPDTWSLLLSKIITKIRLYSEKWIVVTPGPGGAPSSYQDFEPLPYDRIVYGAHMYIPHDFTHQGIASRPTGYSYPGLIKLKSWDMMQLKNSLKSLRLFQLKNKTPLWIGEFSAARWAPGAEKYIRDLVQIFNEYKWGWAYFNIGGMHAWNPNYSNEYSSDKNNGWNEHYIGINSDRWKTLRTILGTQSPNEPK